MIASFPTSKLMMGSVIPGFRQQLPPIRIVTFLDHTNHARISRQPQGVNPLVQFKSMNQDHSEGHNFLEKLKKLMNGQQHSGVHGPHQLPPEQRYKMGPPGQKPAMKPGYEAIRENRDWRTM